MIFLKSMKRAGVRPAHVFRCVAYSGDVGLWIGPLFLVFWLLLSLSLSLVNENPSDWNWNSHWAIFARTLAWRAWEYSALLAMITVWLVFTYRLCRAYVHYLRFDHALGTVIVSQIMVWLVAVVFLDDAIYELFWFI